MKRCPTCNRTFTDPNLSFCIEDGTPLVVSSSPAYDADATVVSPSPVHGESGSASTGGQGGAPSDWTGPAYQPPPQFPPPPPAPPKKRTWPWVVGFLALLILVLVGLGVGAAILVPSLRTASQNRNENRTVIFPVKPSPETNSNSNSNTNSPGSNDNLNENENANSNTAPPTDHEVVLSNLKDIEDEWTVANLNADKKKLGKILADDYVGTQTDGTMQSKADYLRDIKPDQTVKHWEFQNLKLALNGSRATLTGLVSLEGSERDEELVLRFTDKFVWRDGRWQAVSSEVAQVKEAEN
jgi:hypothetical protein